jgi:hypothetical protein
MGPPGQRAEWDRRAILARGRHAARPNEVSHDTLDQPACANRWSPLRARRRSSLHREVRVGSCGIGGAPFRLAPETEVLMGDKSPKQKNKNAQQKQTVKSDKQRVKDERNTPKSEVTKR